MVLFSNLCNLFNIRRKVFLALLTKSSQVSLTLNFKKKKSQDTSLKNKYPPFLRKQTNYNTVLLLSILTLSSNLDAAVYKLFNSVYKPITVSDNKIMSLAHSVINHSMKSG